jgi:ribosomal protein S18 acetylase RimI-like enzyme
MTFELLTAGSEKWNRLAAYAEACSWNAGKALARAMKNREFTDWERVLAALDGERICGYCTISKTDCIPGVSYTPYIGFLFVDEACRGHRLSQQMIRCAMDYLKSLGFPSVYLVSDHENLYEKYGFRVIDRKKAFWGPLEKIYIHDL